MPQEQSAIAFNDVLFATDFSSASIRAFPYALTIADHYQSNLYIAHVTDPEPFGPFSRESSSKAIDQAHEQARQQIEQLFASQGLQGERFRAIVREGKVAQVLLDINRENGIDLIVLGTHGCTARKKLLVGSVAEEVLRMSPCPVLTIGPQGASPPAKPELLHILYLVEFAPDSSRAADYAVSLAEQYGVNLTVMHVSEDMRVAPNQAEQIMQPAARWLEDHTAAGSDLRKRIRLERGFGPASAAILDFAAKSAVDLIVLSAHRLDPVIAAHLPRPDTAYQIVSRAQCPVLTIRDSHA
jgi:nucleotide-binding universal stress UspA family protein